MHVAVNDDVCIVVIYAAEVPTQSSRRTAAVPAATGDAHQIDEVAWWQDVLALHSGVEHRLATALRSHRVGLSDYRTLSLLAGAPKTELRILDLADALNLSQSSVSRLVDRLEAAELVYRQACGDDRRGVFTVLTTQGKRLVAAITPAYKQALREALAHAVAENGALGDVAQSLREARQRGH